MPEVSTYKLAVLRHEQSTLTLSILDDGVNVVYGLECNPCFGRDPIGWTFGPSEALALIAGFQAGEPLLMLAGRVHEEVRADYARRAGLLDGPRGEVIEVDGEFVEVGGSAVQVRSSWTDDVAPGYDADDMGCAGGICTPVSPLRAIGPGDNNDG